MTSDSAGLDLGTDLDGRYRVGARIVSDGVLDVYEATDLRLDRPVVVKVLDAALATDPATRARFEEAARAAAGVVDPALTPVYDSGEVSGRPYVIAEDSGQRGSTGVDDGGAVTTQDLTAALLGPAGAAGTTVAANPADPADSAATVAMAQPAVGPATGVDPTTTFVPAPVSAGDTQQLEPVAEIPLPDPPEAEVAVDPSAPEARPARKRPEWMSWRPAKPDRRVLVPVAVGVGIVAAVAFALNQDGAVDPLQPSEPTEATTRDRPDLPPEFQQP